MPQRTVQPQDLRGTRAFCRCSHGAPHRPGVVRLFAHAAGGLPSERLLARLAMPVSDNAILRQLKRHVREHADPLPLRAIAIDDWSWRKGSTYGTIVVDLERRTVADVLETRSAKETADWLERRPEIEIVSRDRSGLYAQCIRQGAPQARHVADRFHLLQNLRESIERQMIAISCFGGRSRLPPAPGDRQSVLRSRSRDARELMFEQAKDLHASGKSFVAIAAEIGVGHRTIAKWVEADALPHRRRLTLKPSSPLYFQHFLARRWAEGDKVGRRLFHDIRHRGYTGSRSHLERLLSEWRRAERPATSRPRESTREGRAIDPATGWQISPVVAAALCMKPTRMTKTLVMGELRVGPTAGDDWARLRCARRSGRPLRMFRSEPFAENFRERARFASKAAYRGRGVQFAAALEGDVRYSNFLTHPSKKLARVPGLPLESARKSPMLMNGVAII